MWSGRRRWFSSTLYDRRTAFIIPPLCEKSFVSEGIDTPERQSGRQYATAKSVIYSFRRRSLGRGTGADRAGGSHGSSCRLHNSAADATSATGDSQQRLARTRGRHVRGGSGTVRARARPDERPGTGVQRKFLRILPPEQCDGGGQPDNRTASWP